MTYVVADRVKQSCDITGLGNIVLTASVVGYQTFATVCADGDVFHYVAVNLVDGTWETGLGTYVAATSNILRNVLHSSNNNNPVNFGGGAKEVFISLLSNNIITVNNLGQLDLKDLPTINVKTPVDPGDITPKSYVDSVSGPLRTFNIVGTYSGMIAPTAKYTPTTDVIVKRVQLTNSQLSQNEIVAVLYKNDSAVGTFSIPPASYSSTYTSLSISILSTDYLSVGIQSGYINNFSMALFVQ